MTSRPALRPSGVEMMERALHLDAGNSPDAVGELVGLAEGRRSPLEAAQSLLIARLHRRSDDFAATMALCSVSAALNRIGWKMRSLPGRRRWTGRRMTPAVTEA